MWFGHLKFNPSYKGVVRAKLGSSTLKGMSMGRSCVEMWTSGLTFGSSALYILGGPTKVKPTYIFL